jgi:hypothetical protein
LQPPYDAQKQIWNGPNVVGWPKSNVRVSVVGEETQRKCVQAEAAGRVEAKAVSTAPVAVLPHAPRDTVS